VRREQASLSQIGTRWEKELDAVTKRLEERIRRAYALPQGEMRDLVSHCEADMLREEEKLKGELRAVSLWIRVFWPNEEAVRLSILRERVRGQLDSLRAVRDALLDPHCSLSETEKTEVCLELVAALGGHEQEIKRHLLRYNAAVDETVQALTTLPPLGIRELARRRANALRHIREKAATLRRKTEEQLKSDVRSAKRAQNRFARELRKVGLSL
jgi:hypothetical protein